MFCIFPDVATGKEKGDTGKYYYIVWEKDKLLQFADFKVKHQNDTTGYLAHFKDANGKRVDTLLENEWLMDYIYYGTCSGDTNTFKIIDDTTYIIDDPIARSYVTVQDHYDIDGDTLTYNVFAVFYPNQSFIRIRTNQILAHERMHFDITELRARKIKQYFNEKLSKKNSLSILDSLRVFENEAQEMHKIFDVDQQADEMNNASLLKSNREWSNKIQSQLDKLKKYESHKGRVLLK